MSGASVIVFGATGKVGGAAAREAAEKGAKVWLATRDTSKTISWLTKAQEDSGIFSRVQADLTDPSSITAAIEKSGAKSAFVYLPNSEKGLQPAFQALKDAGVTWVVVLSSFTVKSDPRSYTPENVVPYKHAQGELALENVGLSFAVVRPGFFASNVFLWYVPDIKKSGEISLLYPEIEYDLVVPENIGQVAGALLTQPKPHLKPSEPEIVDVYGPQLISQENLVKKIAKVAGKDVKITSVSEEEYTKFLSGKGYPPPLIKYVISLWNETKAGRSYLGRHPNGAGNALKYTGKKAISIDEYLDSIKSQL